MDTIQINELRATILRRLEELLTNGMRHRESILIQKASDTMDEVQFASERDLAIRILDHDCVETRIAKGALARFEVGTYGLCVRCDKAIGWKRLRAVPHAAFCLACQEDVDRNGFDERSLDHELAGPLRA